MEDTLALFMEKAQAEKSKIYQIKVQGDLVANWGNWFSDFDISREKSASGDTITTIEGDIVDQAELRGILNKLRDLNLILISVYRLQFDNE